MVAASAPTVDTLSVGGVDWVVERKGGKPSYKNTKTGETTFVHPVTTASAAGGLSGTKARLQAARVANVGACRTKWTASAGAMSAGAVWMDVMCPGGRPRQQGAGVASLLIA